MKLRFKGMLAVVLAMLMLVSVCVGCSIKSEPKATEPSLEQRVSEEVKNKIQFVVGFQYEIVGLPEVTTYVQETGTNTYSVTGKVTVKDKYGDTYTGKYDATATYSPETDEISVSQNIDTLYKD